MISSCFCESGSFFTHIVIKLTTSGTNLYPFLLIAMMLLHMASVKKSRIDNKRMAFNNH